MLQPVMHTLKNKFIVLASGSPRRKELIENIGLKVTLCPSTFEENLNPKDFKSFSAFVEETALQKVLEVDRRLAHEGRPPDVVIGADTMVTLDGNMFGKPTSEEEAFQMLSSLSGRGHTVYTGVVIKAFDKVVKFTESTNVFFGNIDESQIRAYIATGEPMDKAGGYGIQGAGGTLVERIEGDYFTVVGLPLYRLCSTLYNMFRDGASGS
ncbi:dTTP/UTP pyrophosphatase-like [Galleria mellonella]|uniref:dTTP/UTP pyrophosphatase-like n=1 Tax=Galleria mellonella TaxID=7137 RepID=A0A6J1WV97_GALME|nr:dTTP/UTP pyrophosphatase-like [Galleria mellonella]